MLKFKYLKLVCTLLILGYYVTFCSGDDPGRIFCNYVHFKWQFVTLDSDGTSMALHLIL